MPLILELIEVVFYRNTPATNIFQAWLKAFLSFVAARVE
jgi:hypothetical protein